MGVHGEEVGSGGVDAGDDEVGADVALVAEEVLLQEGHAGDDAGLAAGGEGVQLELGGDEGRGELGVGRCAGTGAPDVGSDVVQLLTVLVGYNWAGCCAGVGSDLTTSHMLEESVREDRESAGGITHHYTTVKYASDDGRSCACRLGQRHSSSVEGRIAVVV